MEKDRCIVWKEQNKLDFNLFDNKMNKTKQLSKEEFYTFLNKELPKFKRKVVINGGHFIPSLINPDKIGKNPTETWRFACSLAKLFSDKGVGCLC